MQIMTAPTPRPKTVRELAHWLAAQATPEQYVIAQDALTEHEYYSDHPTLSQEAFRYRKAFIAELNRQGLYIPNSTITNALNSAIRSIQIAERIIYAAEFN